jgi:hypothetical protein
MDIHEKIARAFARDNGVPDDHYLRSVADTDHTAVNQRMTPAPPDRTYATFLKNRPPYKSYKSSGLY